MNHTKRDEHSNSWNLAKKQFLRSVVFVFVILMQLPIYAEGQDAVDPVQEIEEKRVRKKDKTHQMNQV